ncbi:35-cyclic nucleotide phosphodiesterase family protein [Brugia malayi]|uniref:Phosphodiesterase n=2 Tax=Brugia TaxID=6278 RepID=A0A4E9FBM2_BRUMA|nr:35-cyclic nucleotide phosphodiesterase family protein [Brugia malayi]VIO93534.1 35-cyclic nucleotide phosphodiesterase family protein [Brugia malayi]
MSSNSKGITRSEALDESNQLDHSRHNLYDKKITMMRSCSEVTPRVDYYSSWPGQLAHSRSGASSEMPLIGECRYCDQSCRCSCCPCCDHLIIIYAPSSKPRLSSITFSTVTSATGLPTIAAEPSRPRSSSYWKQPDREGCKSGTNPENKHHLQPQTSSTPITDTSTLSDQGKQKEDTVLTKISKSSSGTQDGEDDVNIVACTSLERIEESVIRTSDGTNYSCKELNSDDELARIAEWGFPIFRFAERYPTTTLSRIAYSIFREHGLFRIFKLSPNKFFNFFHSLECGYWDIPYHNRIHAADVLHGCYYLTCHPVCAFLGTPTNSPPESSLSISDNSPLPLSNSMSTLELMALFTAAAMHDYDHPGRTNAFLVAAEDKKAILYNDRSVLENHHAAESWRLLSKSENSFIETLDAAETKRFRYLVLEYILATDLKLHFDIIMQFNEKAPDMDLSNESHRVIISQMLIKFADINSPSKPYPLHRQWTDRICEEFYGQGDEEKRRGMAVSPYMDRDDPAVAKLQDSFISHIVNPLAVALNEAGLLPILPGLEEPELIINLKHNHQKWLNELEGKMTSTKVMESGSTTTTTATTNAITQPTSLSLKTTNHVIVEENSNEEQNSESCSKNCENENGYSSEHIQ